MRQDNLDEHLVVVFSTVLKKRVVEKNNRAKWKSNRSCVISNYLDGLLFEETYCNGTNSCLLKIKTTETEWFASSDLFSQSRSLFKVRVLLDFRWDLYHGIPHQKFSWTVDFSWQRKMIIVQFCSQIHIINFFHFLQVGESQKQMSFSYQGNWIPILNKQAMKVYSSFLFPFFHLIFFLF